MDESSAPLIHTISISASVPCKLVRWYVQRGDRIQKGRSLCTYVQQMDNGCWEEREQNVRSSVVGIVNELLHKEGAIVEPGAAVAKVEENCDHSVVVYDLCALCGKNLRKPASTLGSSEKHAHSATVSMIHGIPELRVSQKEAEVLGNKDKQRLLESQKLALVVDLDQTLIHTSMDPNIESGLPDVHTFTLPGYPARYHCRLRPYTNSFLKLVSQYYELHVFTMGTKSYAKRVTEVLDPGRRLFCDRIISRDECFDPTSKVLQLKSVFPCGDSMVAIIDDREDVWGGCPNLVHVKPYVFFAGTADINAPPSTHSTPSPHPVEEAPSPSHDPYRPLKRRFLPSGALKREPPVPVVIPAPPPVAHSPVRMPGGGGGASDSSHAPLNDNNNNNINSLSGGRGGDNDGDDGNNDGGGGDEGGDDDEDDDNDGRDGGEGGVDKRGSSSSSSSSSESSDSEEGSGGSSSSGIDEGLFETGDNLPPSGSQTDDRQQQSPEVTSVDKSGQEGMLVPMDPAQEKVVNTEGVGGHSEAVEPSTVQVKSEDRSIEVTSAADDNRVRKDVQPSPKSEEGKSLASNPPSHSEQTSSAEHPEQVTTSVKSMAREIKDSDNFLHYLGDTLRRIHSTFYSEYHLAKKRAEPALIPNLKEIIPRLRQSVLKGARVLFTGVIPTNVAPRKSPEWCTAVAFGAVIHEELVPGLHSCDHRKAQRATTHVIAGRPGTNKLKEAMKTPGVKLVSPAWLWACAERWQWVEESLFPLAFDHHAKDREEKGRSFCPLKKESECGADMKEPDKSRKEGNSKGEVACEGEGGELEDEAGDEDEECQRDLDKIRPQHVGGLDSYLSVSDEELEKMEAEVDAEIGDSSSDSKDDEHGGGDVPAGDVIPQVEEDPLSGLLEEDAEKSLDPSGELEEREEEEEEEEEEEDDEEEGLHGRKRKRVDAESNSSTSAGKGEGLEQSSEDDGSGVDDLALLLGNDD